MNRKKVLAGALGALAIACGGQEVAAVKAAARVDGAPAYLALGDSVAFGLDPRLVPKPAFSCFSCGSFTSMGAPPNDNVFVGYPEYLQETLGVPLENASCPGETSASFRAPTVPGQAAICGQFKEEGWLHAAYDGGQLRHALDFLERHPRVELVTVAIGANDLLDLVAGCGGDGACIAGGAGGVLSTVGANVSGILQDVRNAGYAGPIVVPLYYAPSPVWTELVSGLNAYLELAAGQCQPTVVTRCVPSAVTVPLQAVFGSTPCKDGLLIRLDPLDPADPDAGCDIHPSEAGARRIAAAIASAVGR